MIDVRGKLVPMVCGPKIKEIDDIFHLIVVPSGKSASGLDLTISQADLDSLMRSKAAMYTILETLTGQVGLTPEQLETFYVAGTFGCFIDPEAAVTIGMLPDLPLERYRPLGNSALGGAVLLLSDAGVQEEILTIQTNITYLELNVNQEFMNRFSAAKFLPHTINAFTTTRRAQKFPFAASVRISLSRVRSDTARRNRWFSFSSSFRRASCDLPIPP